MDKITLDRNYLVYCLTSSNEEKVRYIGITNNIVARISGHLRDVNRVNVNTHKKKWIKSIINNGYTLKYEIIESDLSQIEAFEKEKKYILMFKSFGAKLVNGTLGGDGVIPTKETIDKIKKNRKPFIWTYEMRLAQSIRMKGKKASFETRNKMSLSQKKIGNKPDQSLRKKFGCPPHRKGVTVTKEIRDKISNSKKGVISPKRKKVIQIDPKTKEVICIYESLTKAMEVTKVNNIHRCIKNKTKTAGNYEWKYKD